MYCLVPDCRNGTGNGTTRPPGIKIHRLPKDADILALWLKAVKRKDKINLKNACVCSAHFVMEDYERDLKFELLNPGKGTMDNPRRHLKRNAVPSQNISDSRVKGKASLKKQKADKAKTKAAPKTTAPVDEPDPDDPVEIRKRSRQLRKERQEQKERKALVEQLLAEHDERQRQEAIRKQWPQPPLEVIELVEYGGVRKRRRRRGLDDGPPTAVEEAQFPSEPAITFAPSDGDLSPPEDDGPAPCDYSDGETEPPSAADPPAAPVPTRPAASPRKPDRPTYYRKIVKKTALSARQMAWCKGSNLMVERTKELLRLKHLVRRLEARCLRVLSRPDGPPVPAADGGEEGGEELPTEDGEETQELPPPDGEAPLVVLRASGSARHPPLLSRLKHHQLPDSLSTFTPSDLSEAQELNHQLKVRFLALQVAMLKWAIRNRQLREARLETGERRQRCMKTVRGSRLRELLQLETAVKAMFTEAQIRGIIREHGGGLPGERRTLKYTPQWGEEDLRRVLELRAISSERVVDHVRDKMKIPLPSLKTATRRCRQQPELAEAYGEMLRRGRESQRRCCDCQRGMDAVDEVVAAVEEIPSAEWEDESTYDRQVVQRGDGVQRVSQAGRQEVGIASGAESGAWQRNWTGRRDSIGAGWQKKKRGRPPAERRPMEHRSPAKKARPSVSELAEIGCLDASDTDSEFSDRSLWSQSTPLTHRYSSWSEVPTDRDSTPASVRPRPPPLPTDPAVDPYRDAPRTWR